jgi:hypothetical protein
MSKYYEVIVDGKLNNSFTGSNETRAINCYSEMVKNNPQYLVKLVLHRKKELLTSKNQMIKHEK